MKRFLVLLAIGAVLICSPLAFTAYTVRQSQELEAKYEPKNIVLDQGVFIQPAAVRSIFGGTPVEVHASQDKVDTMGAKTIDANGITHAWVPSTFTGSAQALTPSEAQEYVLRELAKCPGECLFDSANTPLDAGTLGEMAADPNVTRTGSSEMMSTFLLASTAKHALDKQAEVAMHGMDKIAEVAESGDKAQTWTVALFNLSEVLGNSLAIGIIAIVVVAGILILLKKS